MLCISPNCLKNKSVSNYADMKYLAFILAFMMPSLAAAEGRFFHDDNLTRDDLKNRGKCRVGR